MPAKLNLAYQRFGKLFVISEHGKDKHGAILWECLCDCGNKTIARGSQIYLGQSQSCGCGISEAAVLNQTTHGQSGTPLHNRWLAMRSRCKNPKNSEYRNYGGRGIGICKNWDSFECFAKDMGETFDPRLTLERINNNGDYEPTNCSWVPYKQQQRNKRTNHRISVSGESMILVEAEEKTGIKANTILTRLRRGWLNDEALELANK